ncbi:20963_t:CDS:2, partial [Gigaspora rosea]
KIEFAPISTHIRERYCFIPQQVVEDAVRECNVCAIRRLSKRVPPIRAIVSEAFLAHVQIDTINMTMTPDESYKYIIHIRDHFTQFSYAEPSQTKSAQDAAICLFNFCLMYGPPTILHSDNGREFVDKVVQETLNHWPNIKIFHGRPRNSQCQGLVKKGNDILQVMLGSWMEETHRTDWRAMNNQYSSAHKTTPYNFVFGKYPYCNTSRVDILENDQQNEEPNSSFYDFPETNSEATFVTADSDGDYNDYNYLDSSTSQVYSLTPQEFIDGNDSDSSQESMDTVVSQRYTAQEKEKWRDSSIEVIDKI